MMMAFWDNVCVEVSMGCAKTMAHGQQWQIQVTTEGLSVINEVDYQFYGVMKQKTMQHD